MGIRQFILMIFILGICVYAFRDWFLSLAALILLTVLTQNDDMPRTMAGIQGLNPWNFTLAITTLSWAIDRVRHPRPIGIPISAFIVAGLYIMVVLVNYLRVAVDTGSLPPEYPIRSFMDATTELWINPMKYLWAALMFADGCTTRERVRLAVTTVVLLGVFYGAFVLKNVSITHLFSPGNFMGVRNRIDKLIGLHANDMAKVLVMTFWSIFATHRLWPQKKYKMIAVGSAIITMLATGLCFSRAGYVTFVGIGFIFACLRFRKLLFIGPIALVVIVFMFPNVAERMLMDMGENAATGQTDMNQVTAGRTGNLWPPTIEEIRKSPLIGHGGLALLRTDAYEAIKDTEGHVPTTPHNGFLDVMVNSGAVGMLIVAAFYLGTGVASLVLLRNRTDVLAIAVGGVGLAHVTGCLINALSGGVLMPSQGMLGTYAAMGIAVHMWAGRNTRLRPVAPRRRVYVRVPMVQQPFPARQT